MKYHTTQYLMGTAALIVVMRRSGLVSLIKETILEFDAGTRAQSTNVQ
jgi:hypothetical protein